MPSFVVADTNSLYKTNVSYLNTDDNKWETFTFDRYNTITQTANYDFLVPLQLGALTDILFGDPINTTLISHTNDCYGN